jgi:hypothetical protein
VQGYVEPCGCTAEPLGGIARLAAAVADARVAYGGRVVVLDGGDMLFEKLNDNAPADRCQADARIDLLLDNMQRIGLAATVLGPLDDVRGAAFRDERFSKRGLITLGVPNATRPFQHGALHTPSRVIDAAGVQVGVTAVRLDSEAGLATAQKALQAEVASMRAQGAQAVVVLVQAAPALTDRLVDESEADIAIQGRAPGEVPVAPRKTPHGVVVVASGQQAQHLGVLELVLDGRTGPGPLVLDARQAEVERRQQVLSVRIKEFEAQLALLSPGAVDRRAFLEQRRAAADTERASLRVDALPAPTGPHVVARAIALSRQSPEDSAAAAALTAYTTSIPALVKACEGGLICPPAPAGSASFVGVQSCQGCHVSQAAFWRSMRVKLPGRDKRGAAIVRELGHARAWDTLKPDDKQRDRSCVGCHAVGWNQPGGPCKTTDIDARGLGAVQCEACHGPGSLHVAAAGKGHITREVPESTCRECHQVPHIETTESFVFEQKRAAIIGPGHGLPVKSAPSATGAP